MLIVWLSLKYTFFFSNKTMKLSKHHQNFEKIITKPLTSLKRGKTDSTLLDCWGSKTMLRRKSNVSFIFFLIVSSSAECFISAMASLHSSSLRTVSGTNCGFRLAAGPPSPSSWDAPSDDATQYGKIPYFDNHMDLQAKKTKHQIFQYYYSITSVWWSSVSSIGSLYSFNPPG